MATHLIRFIHLTDTHIAVGPGSVQFGIDTSDAFQRVLREVATCVPSPDFVLITGDLVNDGLPESYEAFRDILKILSCPVYLALGNHDRREAFRRVVLGEFGTADQPYCYTFQVGGTDFIVLDSYLAGTSAGRIDRPQLRWLEEQLSRCQGRPVVCVHHHPVPTGLAWLDRLILLNGEEAVGIVQGNPLVSLLIFGHIHRPLEGKLGATRLLGTPSTCFQFGPRSESREISTEPPAYRLVILEDGQVASEVRWLPGPQDTAQD